MGRGGGQHRLVRPEKKVVFSNSSRETDFNTLEAPKSLIHERMEEFWIGPLSLFNRIYSLLIHTVRSIIIMYSQIPIYTVRIHHSSTKKRLGKSKENRKKSTFSLLNMIKGMIAPHDQIQSSLFWSTAQIKGNIFVMLTPLKPPKTSNRSEQNKKKQHKN